MSSIVIDLQDELNGYPDQNACPDYRKVRGTLFGYLRK